LPTFEKLKVGISFLHACRDAYCCMSIMVYRTAVLCMVLRKRIMSRGWSTFMASAAFGRNRRQTTQTL